MTTHPAPGTLGPVRASAAAVAARRVSARSLVEESLRRIAAAADLGAVVALRAEEALAQADALDRSLAAGIPPPGPLAGVPVLVKDLEDVAGLPTRRGSRLFAGARPAVEDEVVPARLVAAGGIVVGKTALPELAVEGFTASLPHGVTRNPWSPQRSPGGSSGGSGAALAAGLAPVATGTDGGGSVRIPAALCGLLGLKPTHGLVGRWPAADWLDLSTYGPMAHDADDLRLLLTLMAGLVPGDPDSAPPPVDLRAPDAGPPVRRLLAAERTSPFGPLPAAVADRLRTGVGALAEWLDPGEVFGAVGDPDLDWWVLAAAEHVASLTEALGGRDRVAAAVDEVGLLHPSTREFLAGGLGIDVATYLGARRRRPRYTRRLDDLLGAGAVLVTPTVAADAWAADGRVDPEGPVRLLPADVYSTAVQNITGHPALSLPWRSDAAGVPSGLQVTAPRWRDPLLLDLAARWQAAHPWPASAPGYEPWPIHW
jgi:Asp-tRNA(Asn)/Glu-tRNA(Gln) amidotransferase A subunit family amidase